MASHYKLSKAAVKSITEIIHYTNENFGKKQTAAYMAGLEQSFDLLVNFAGIGAAAFEIKHGLRRYRYQSHSIFYSIQGDIILIEDILHISRNIGPDLFDI